QGLSDSTGVMRPAYLLCKPAITPGLTPWNRAGGIPDLELKRAGFMEVYFILKSDPIPIDVLFQAEAEFREIGCSFLEVTIFLPH
ncbi:MAG: hypothetical protein Q8Q15_04490, partial [bacterium]|nr:hypothetical protein [bacterium]